MHSQQRTRFICGQTAMLLGAIIVLALLEMLSLEFFFVIALIGFLIVTELTAPTTVTPRWRARLKWLIGLGLLVFVYIVIRRIIEILPPEVV